VQRGLFGAVTFVVNRDAITHPAGLLHGDLHALLTSRRWWFTVTEGKAARRSTRF
jgi:hypothetical protein